MRLAEELSESKPAREALLEAARALRESLLQIWPLVPPSALAWLAFEWNRDGRERMSACSGIEFTRLLRPVAVLVLLLSIAGVALLSSEAPDTSSEQAADGGWTWQARDEGQERWIEVGAQGQPKLRSGVRRATMSEGLRDHDLLLASFLLSLAQLLLLHRPLSLGRGVPNRRIELVAPALLSTAALLLDAGLVPLLCEPDLADRWGRSLALVMMLALSLALRESAARLIR